jgi:hypothetical protein
VATERDVSIRLQTKADPKIGDGFKRLQQEAEKANAKLKQLSQEGRINVEKLGSGIGKLTSGVVFLTSKNKDLQQTINTLLSFKGVLDIFSGLKDVVVGATAKLLEYRAAALAAAAANSALAASGAAGAGASTAKGVAAGAAGGAVAGVGGRAVAGAAIGAGIGGALATFGIPAVALFTGGFALGLNRALDKNPEKVLGRVSGFTDLLGLTDVAGTKEELEAAQARRFQFRQLRLLGARLPLEEEQAQQRLQIRRPFEDRARSLREDRARLFDQTAADRRGLTGTDRDLFALERERTRALAEQRNLAQELARARGSERSTLAEVASIQDRLGRATQDRLRIESDILGRLRAQREEKAGLVRGALGRVEDLGATFGSLSPLEQRGVVETSRRIQQQGGFERLSAQQRKALSEGPGGALFADPLRRAAVASAEKTPGFQQFLQATGQDVKSSVARAEAARIEIEKKIRVELTLDDQAIAKQITERVGPALEAALVQIPAQLDVAIRQAAAASVAQNLQALQANRRAATGR